MELDVQGRHDGMVLKRLWKVLI